MKDFIRGFNLCKLQNIFRFSQSATLIMSSITPTPFKHPDCNPTQISNLVSAGNNLLSIPCANHPVINSVDCHEKAH